MGALAQSSDLSHQISLIKDFLPKCYGFAILFNPDNGDLQTIIQQASQENGLVAYLTPISSTRDISPSIRSLNKYAIDFIFLMEDRIVTGKSTTRYAVKMNSKKNIPVFSSAENAFEHDAFGRFVRRNGLWHLVLNRAQFGEFSFKPPEANPRISIE